MGKTVGSVSFWLFCQYLVPIREKRAEVEMAWLVKLLVNLSSIPGSHVKIKPTLVIPALGKWSSEYPWGLLAASHRSLL